MGGLGGMPGLGAGMNGGLDFSTLVGSHAAGGMPPTPGSTPAAPAPAVPAAVPPTERFAAQLTQLQEMGFSDDARSLQALVQTQGNVNAAVERLLSQM